MNSRIRQLLDTLPDNPGVYQFFDTSGKLIYIGKAKNLKKRVASYFNNSEKGGKVYVLVQKIADIKHIVVNSESDALLLENNLIKEHQPKYNILLKDDKTYPWIVIRNELFPRVHQTRSFVKDGSLYYGPYTSGLLLKNLLELIKVLFPIRTCSLPLTMEGINAGKFKNCLEYHIGNCKAPCEGLFSEREYADNVEQIKFILKGNIGSVTDHLKQLMKKYSEEYRFEEAQRMKEKLNMIENFQSKSAVVSTSIFDLDVFSCSENDNGVYVNFMKIVRGAVIQSHNVEVKRKLDESLEDILLYCIVDFRQKGISNSREVIVPFQLEDVIDQVKFIVPKQGDKLKLLELSERNAKYFKLESLKKKNILVEKKSGNRVLLTLQNDLNLKELPVHIECFDNSNIQGTNPVAACVVFKNAKPSKNDYRHFHIKSVEGPNDFASMEEVVYRRYSRLVEENLSLPQLIIIDGGKGQLGAALNSLEKLNLRGKIPVIGIAKRLEEIFFPGDQFPIYLDKKSESLKLIQNLRNEAHRFGITFHRNLRSKNQLKSDLENINGIGEKTIEILLKKFKSVNIISKLPENEISEVIGRSKAKIVYNYFNSDYFYRM